MEHYNRSIRSWCSDVSTTISSDSQPVPEAAEQQTAHTGMLHLQLIVL